MGRRSKLQGYDVTPTANGLKITQQNNPGWGSIVIDLPGLQAQYRNQGLGSKIMRWHWITALRSSSSETKYLDFAEVLHLLGHAVVKLLKQDRHNIRLPQVQEAIRQLKFHRQHKALSRIQKIAPTKGLKAPTGKISADIIILCAYRNLSNQLPEIIKAYKDARHNHKIQAQQKRYFRERLLRNYRKQVRGMHRLLVELEIADRKSPKYDEDSQKDWINAAWEIVSQKDNLDRESGGELVVEILARINGRLEESIRASISRGRRRLRSSP